MKLVSMWRYQRHAYGNFVCIALATWLCIFQSISMCLDATIHTMLLQFMWCVCVLLEATMRTIGYNLCICLYMHVCVEATVYEM